MCQISTTLKGDHCAAYNAGEQREGVEQLPEAAGVGRNQQVVKVERHTLQQVAKRNPEDQRRHCSTHKESPVPSTAPGGVVDLAAIVKTHRAEEQRPEDQN